LEYIDGYIWEGIDCDLVKKPTPGANIMSDATLGATLKHFAIRYVAMTGF